MTDHTKLIERLRSHTEPSNGADSFYGTRTVPLPTILESANALAALVAERDKWRNAALTNDTMSARQKDRAEKAEAELAAARAALRYFDDFIKDIPPGHEHYAAIAAARAEGGE